MQNGVTARRDGLFLKGMCGMLTNAELAIAAEAADKWPAGFGDAVALRDGVGITSTSGVLPTDQL